MEGRNSDGTFKKGFGGRNPGSRNKATFVMRGLLDEQTEALGQNVVELALEGDIGALRLCLERVCPARKDSPIQFDLPEITSAQDAAEAAKSVLSAVASGEITPLEGAAAMGLVEAFRQTLETTDFERRIANLENRNES